MPQTKFPGRRLAAKPADAGQDPASINDNDNNDTNNDNNDDDHINIIVKVI